MPVVMGYRSGGSELQNSASSQRARGTTAVVSAGLCVGISRSHTMLKSCASFLCARLRGRGVSPLGKSARSPHEQQGERCNPGLRGERQKKGKGKEKRERAGHSAYGCVLERSSASRHRNGGITPPKRKEERSGERCFMCSKFFFRQMHSVGGNRSHQGSI